MTPQQARDRFSEAFEGELSADERAAFDAALDADEALRDEYEQFRRTMREMRSLGAADDSAEHVDLLAGVQRRLRARSRGRYYRDRFSEGSRTRSLLPVLAGVVMLIALGLVLFALHFVTIESGPPEDRDAPPTSEPDNPR